MVINETQESVALFALYIKILILKYDISNVCKDGITGLFIVTGSNPSRCHLLKYILLHLVFCLHVTFLKVTKILCKI